MDLRFHYRTIAQESPLCHEYGPGDPTLTKDTSRASDFSRTSQVRTDGPEVLDRGRPVEERSPPPSGMRKARAGCRKILLDVLKLIGAVLFNVIVQLLVLLIYAIIVSAHHW